MTVTALMVFIADLADLHGGLSALFHSTRSEREARKRNADLRAHIDRVRRRPRKAGFARWRHCVPKRASAQTRAWADSARRLTIAARSRPVASGLAPTFTGAVSLSPSASRPPTLLRRPSPYTSAPAGP